MSCYVGGRIVQECWFRASVPLHTHGRHPALARKFAQLDIGRRGDHRWNGADHRNGGQIMPAERAAFVEQIDPDLSQAAARQLLQRVIALSDYLFLRRKCHARARRRYGYSVTGTRSRTHSHCLRLLKDLWNSVNAGSAMSHKVKAILYENAHRPMTIDEMAAKLFLSSLPSTGRWLKRASIS